jgi:hypothetical protein
VAVVDPVPVLVEPPAALALEVAPVQRRPALLGLRDDLLDEVEIGRLAVLVGRRAGHLDVPAGHLFHQDRAELAAVPEPRLDRRRVVEGPRLEIVEELSDRLPLLGSQVGGNEAAGIGVRQRGESVVGHGRLRPDRRCAGNRQG